MTTNGTCKGGDEEQPGIGRDHPAKRIEDEHRTLRSQLDAVAAAASRKTLLESLLGLPERLREHFALEEEANGLYDDLQIRGPSVAPRLDALRDEHRVILEEIGGICRKLEERPDTEQSIERITESVARDVARWLRRLRNHEHEESGLIRDVYYTDEGGRG